MAEIITAICDRCNKEIEYGFTAKHELQKKRFRLFDRSCYSVNGYSKVDLCKECQAELDKWFEKGRAKRKN